MKTTLAAIALAFALTGPTQRLTTPCPSSTKSIRSGLRHQIKVTPPRLPHSTAGGSVFPQGSRRTGHWGSQYPQVL